jgi:hypothetical protein
MEIFRLNNEPDKNGWFPIPDNLINRMMFMYPYLGEEDKWDTKERENRKINAIVSYWGEYFERKNIQWYIGMMGKDNIVIFDENNKEYDCYYRWYVYNGGRFIYKFNFETEDQDWLTYDKNKDIYLRMEKIDKIINKL